TAGPKTHTYADGPAARAITVDLTDEDGTNLNRANPLSVTVNNAAPVAALAGPSAGVRNQPRHFTLSASDPSGPDTAAGVVYTIDWGDGSRVETIAPTAGNGRGVGEDHVFTTAGTYTLTVTATDRDGGTSAPATHPFAVTAVGVQADPADPSKVDLF